MSDKIYFCSACIDDDSNPCELKMPGIHDRPRCCCIDNGEQAKWYDPYEGMTDKEKIDAGVS